MDQSQQFGPTNVDGESLISRVFGVGFRRETYKNLAYLLARFPLGIVYFTVLVTGLSMGVALTPLFVGLPILAGVLAVGGYIGVVEAELLHRLYGHDVAYDVPDPSELPITEYLKTVVTTPSNYLLVLLGFASFAAGNVLFVAITVVFTLALAFVVAPLVYWMPAFNYELTQGTETVDIGSVSVEISSIAGGSINTLPEALLASLLGVVVCLVGLHAINLTARLLSGLTQRLVQIQSH
jgi:hypothetical protein